MKKTIKIKDKNKYEIYNYYFHRQRFPPPPQVTNISRFCGKCLTNHTVEL